MSDTVRVYEVAKELGVPSKDLVQRLQDMGADVTTHSSSISQDLADRLIAGEAEGTVEAPEDGQTAEPEPEPEPEPEAPAAPEEAAEPEPEEAEVPAAGDGQVAAAPAIHIPRGITIKEFAEKLELSPTQVIQTLMGHGAMKTVTESMGDEEILVLADDLGLDVEVVEPDVEEHLEAEEEDLYDPESYVPRPPVVTVMGHVDHGKTTVLDRVRQTDVVAGEHGGITQHIGAYQVHRDENVITFLDTPGHEAFTAMRARGAQATDIAILVVAADDGVKPQTIEALDHARAATVPIIVAVNKIDRPESDPNRVRTELSEVGLQPEEWGGETLFVDISAKTGDGIDDLLTGILLVAEDRGLQAPGEGPARGVVIEAHLDKGRGSVATVLVQQGVLEVGDVVVAGTAWGKIRAMLDEWGDEVETAGPARPVLTLGWNAVPEAGDDVRVVADEKEGRSLAQDREAARRRAEMVSAKPAVTLEELFAETDELNLVLKADVQGSLEAVTEALHGLDVGDVEVKLIHRAVGAINESDVTLAQASEAIVVGFNVRPDANARQMAEQEGVEIRTYRVIYELIDEIEQALKGMLAPEYREVVLGSAEIRETFKIPRGMAAGCYVTNGQILRNAKARLVRDGTVVYEGGIDTLRRFKDDVRDVQQGFECGITLEDFTDIKVGDVIEAFEIREISPV